MSHILLSTLHLLSHLISFSGIISSHVSVVFKNVTPMLHVSQKRECIRRNHFNYKKENQDSKRESIICRSLWGLITASLNGLALISFHTCECLSLCCSLASRVCILVPSKVTVTLRAKTDCWWPWPIAAWSRFQSGQRLRLGHSGESIKS